MRTVLMSRIEAISESGIKGAVDRTPRCGLFGYKKAESIVALEEFARMRGCLSSFSRAGSAAAACALVILFSGVPAVPRAEPLAGPQAAELGPFLSPSWL